MQKLKLLLPLVCLLALSSCNMKECRCYQFVGDHWVGPNAAYTNPSYSCTSLNTSNTFCNEMDDPILNPNDIAVGKKNRK